MKTNPRPTAKSFRFGPIELRQIKWDVGLQMTPVDFRKTGNSFSWMLKIRPREKMAPYENPVESNEWYTPKYIFDALGVSFDLDVAAPKEGPRYVPARDWLWTNSLEANWQGFVWMNPPFGNQQNKLGWLRKFVLHGNGIALLPDRTSASWWQDFAPLTDAFLFISPKVKFERPDGSVGKSPGGGTTLFAIGEKGVSALMRATELGHVFQIAKPEARKHNRYLALLR